MVKELITIGNLKALLIGEKSDKVYLFVHGKSGNKEEAIAFAEIANKKGWQVLSVDLPQHGERKHSEEKFDPWTIIPELRGVMEYMKRNWKRIALRANSIGAWFSMMSFRSEDIEKALLVSPMVNMERLIGDMMGWAGVSEEELKEKGEINTSFGEVLSWKYLCYVRENPIMWDVSTSVLYADKDHLVPRSVMDQFIKKYRCELTVMAGGDHWFHTEEQLKVLKEWVTLNIE